MATNMHAYRSRDVIRKDLVEIALGLRGGKITPHEAHEAIMALCSRHLTSGSNRPKNLDQRAIDEIFIAYRAGTSTVKIAKEAGIRKDIVDRTLEGTFGFPSDFYVGERG